MQERKPAVRVVETRVNRPFNSPRSLNMAAHKIGPGNAKR